MPPPPWTTTLKLSTPYTDPDSWALKLRCSWIIDVNAMWRKIKNTTSKRTDKISKSGIAIVSKQYADGHSRQPSAAIPYIVHSTIGFLSNGFLIIFSRFPQNNSSISMQRWSHLNYCSRYWLIIRSVKKWSRVGRIFTLHYYISLLECCSGTTISITSDNGIKRDWW